MCRELEESRRMGVLISGEKGDKKSPLVVRMYTFGAE